MAAFSIRFRTRDVFAALSYPRVLPLGVTSGQEVGVDEKGRPRADQPAVQRDGGGEWRRGWGVRGGPEFSYHGTQ